MLQALAFIGIAIFSLLAGAMLACIVIGTIRWLLGKPLPDFNGEHV